MEGEGVSMGSGGAVVGGSGPPLGASPSMGGFESIGSPSVSVFEAPALNSTAAAGELDPAVGDPEIARIESGVMDAVRSEGTPEAGFQFLSDAPMIGEEMLSSIGDEPVVSLQVEPEIEELGVVPLTPEQQGVLDYQRVNPEYLDAFGQVLSLGPEAMAFFIKALKKSLEEEKQKAKDEEEKKKLNKWEVGLLAFFLLIQLAASAVEKGAKEVSR